MTDATPKMSPEHGLVRLKNLVMTTYTTELENVPGAKAGKTAYACLKELIEAGLPAVSEQEQYEHVAGLFNDFNFYLAQRKLAVLTAELQGFDPKDVRDTVKKAYFLLDASEKSNEGWIEQATRAITELQVLKLKEELVTLLVRFVSLSAEVVDNARKVSRNQFATKTDLTKVVKALKGFEPACKCGYEGCTGKLPLMADADGHEGLGAYRFACYAFDVNEAEELLRKALREFKEEDNDKILVAARDVFANKTVTSEWNLAATASYVKVCALKASDEVEGLLDFHERNLPKKVAQKPVDLLREIYLHWDDSMKWVIEAKAAMKAASTQCFKPVCPRCGAELVRTDSKSGLKGKGPYPECCSDCAKLPEPEEQSFSLTEADLMKLADASRALSKPEQSKGKKEKGKGKKK